MQNVRLIGLTKPCASTGCHTAEELIAWCARVSNPKNQDNHNTASNLVGYLLEHKHFSPFEMVHVSVEIKTTRDIARQILRHKSFSFQEFSQRYANPLDNLNFNTREARLQDKKNRQNSFEVDDPYLQQSWDQYQCNVINAAKEAYLWAIDNGIAKEQARAVLPEGNTESVVVMAGTLRSWIHYIELRSSNGTQKEHMQIANQCKDIILQHFPLLETYFNRKKVVND